MDGVGPAARPRQPLPLGDALPLRPRPPVRPLTTFVCVYVRAPGASVRACLRLCMHRVRVNVTKYARALAYTVLAEGQAQDFFSGIN